MSARESAGIEAEGATVQHVTGEILASPLEHEPIVCEGAILDFEAEHVEIDQVT